MLPRNRLRPERLSLFERELTTRRKQASANGDKSVTVRESLPIRQNRFKLRFMPIALADHETTKVLSMTLLRYLFVVTAKGRREDEPLNRKSGLQDLVLRVATCLCSYGI